MIKYNQLEGLNYSKKNRESITKFHYHLNETIKKISNEKQSSKFQWQLHTVEGQHNILYHYTDCVIDGVQILNLSSILNCAKNIYLGAQCTQLSSYTYLKQTVLKIPLLPVYAYARETIDFVVINMHEYEVVTKIKNDSKMAKKIEEFEEEHKPNQKYILYVIHHCQSNSEGIKWHNFIQQYNFCNNENTQPTISYKMICSYLNKDSIFALNYTNNIISQFEQNYLGLNKNKKIECLSKMQGNLLQCQNQLQIQLKNHDDIAFGPQHCRQAMLPVEHLNNYLKIKKQIYKYHQQYIGIVNPFFIDNLICRYLIAHKYDFQLSQKCTLEYLNWYKQFDQKYSQNDFKQLFDEQIFTYIGEDYQCHPIIFNKACKVKIDQIDNEKYCLFYLYWLQVYLVKKMRGYVDQILIIADLTDLSTSNFKFAVTKRNVADSLKYLPERQYKFLAVNVSFFAFYCWKFIKPMLPKTTQQKINILSNDKKQITNQMLKQMSIDIIPFHLKEQSINKLPINSHWNSRIIIDDLQ